MRILYAETSDFLPTGAHFLEALQAMAERAECEFTFFDEARYRRPQRSIAGRIARRLAGRPAGYRALNAALVAEARRLHPDLVLIGKGAYFAPATLAAVRAATGASMVNWATDDPFNPAASTRDLVESIALYDLYVCTKRAIMDDARRAGCANVAYVRFGYKPQVHFPEAPANDDEARRFESDVTFIGGGDDDRAPYFETLVRAIPELRLHLHGGYWNRYPKLRPYWRGNATGRDFRLAVSGAKISVNLVRRANRDDHVMRTFEIPACGGFMLTEDPPPTTNYFPKTTKRRFSARPMNSSRRSAVILGAMKTESGSPPRGIAKSRRGGIPTAIGWRKLSRLRDR